MRRALVLAVLLLAGCASSSGRSGSPGGGHPRTVTVGFAQKGHTVTLHKGDSIVVRLDSTYWQFRPVAGGVLSGGRPSAHGRPGGVPGAGRGTVTDTFLAVKDGTATIAAGRMSCGEAMRCVGGQGSYSVTVVVR